MSHGTVPILFSTSNQSLEQALPGVENCCCFLTNPEEPSLCPVPQTNRDGTQETTTTPKPIKAIGPRNPFDLLENAPDYEDEFSSTTTETTNKSEQNFAFAVPRVFLPEFIPETVVMDEVGRSCVRTTNSLSFVLFD